MDGEGLPGELRALGRALEGPPPADPGDGLQGDDLRGDSSSAGRSSAADGETMAERVLAQIVGMIAGTPDRAAPTWPGGRIREEQWWRELPGLEAGQGPTGAPGRSADRRRAGPPSARRPRPRP